MDTLKILANQVLAEDLLVADFDPAAVMFSSGTVVWASLEEISALNRRMPFYTDSMVTEYLPGLQFLMEYVYGPASKTAGRKRRPLSIFSRRRKLNANF